MNRNHNSLSCPKCRSERLRQVNGSYVCEVCGYEWREHTSGKMLTIRNSTAEFLIFQAQSQANGVEVLYANETIWCTQKAMAVLFEIDRTVITKHLKNIFDSGELLLDSVCANFAHTANDGKKYQTKFYNLDAIISVGYRVNSTRATQFRQWF